MPNIDDVTAWTVGPQETCVMAQNARKYRLQPLKINTTIRLEVRINLIKIYFSEIEYSEDVEIHGL